MEFIFEEAHDALVGLCADFESHHAREAALAELLLDLLKEILSVLIVALGLSVTRHTERQHVDDLHAGEEVVEVVGDDVLQRNEAAGRAETEEFATGLRHLHACEKRFALTRATQQHAERNRHV